MRKEKENKEIARETKWKEFEKREIAWETESAKNPLIGEKVIVITAI